MNVEQAIKIARLTDVGLHRDHNEDAVASDLSIGLLVLADGMGGYKAGEVASEIAVLTLTAEITEAMLHKASVRLMPGLLPESQMLIDAIESANAAIYQISQEQPQCAGMGTTLVVGIFTDNKLVVGHIGDSRLYCLRQETLIQVTEDHSLLQEQLNSGLITAEQAKTASHKNLVTRALGIDPEVEPEVQAFDVQVGDIFLLCSDGLTDLVEDELIQKILLYSNGNIEFAANKLVQVANEMGGTDNISVVLALIEKPFPSEGGWVKNLFGRVKNKR
ncbi:MULTISPECIES: Stp1/IreP family PP2C-type Ser/Thr phosphatase [Methylotenera]|uniref:Stp1/IreP family PP2C-type Ser/Thr phosphatase n=1 Tax=Methylotenera TaxID=359407 RepID=UPI00037D96AC|nr:MULTISPECIES: Stp1/IreP family PP2C-type Ser/Thr phosphatase [Methylotenera]